MGWLIAFGIVFLLAVLPLGARVRYHSAGLEVRLIAGPVRITLYPRPRKEKKEKEPSDKKTEEDGGEKTPASSKEEKKDEKKEKGGSLTDFLPLVKTALDFLGDFRRKLRLDNLYLRLILASDDPCDLAMNYGRVWTAVGSLLPVLEKYFVIKKRDVEVECDFTASQTLVIAHIDVTITLGRLISLAVKYGIRVIREYLTIQKKRKGGAAK